MMARGVARAGNGAGVVRFGRSMKAIMVGGSQLIAMRMANAIGKKRVLLNKPVRRIAQHKNKVIVKSKHLTVRAKQVIVAIPPTLAGRIDYEPALPPARDQLKKDVNGVARGPENAPVTIVEFSDLQCPHCKQAQPTITKLLADEPNARFVFQQFPLPSHDWAAKAASYADCIGRSNPDAFWKFVDATYNAQTEITAANADEKLKGLADSSGATSADVSACATTPETKSQAMPPPVWISPEAQAMIATNREKPSAIGRQPVRAALNLTPIAGDSPLT